MDLGPIRVPHLPGPHRSLIDHRGYTVELRVGLSIEYLDRKPRAGSEPGVRADSDIVFIKNASGWTRFNMIDICAGRTRG